jgi:hypothetical protein
MAMSHSLIRLAVLFSSACGILLATYPWRIYYGNFHFGLLKTAVSYALVAVLMSIAGALLAPWIVHRVWGSNRGLVVATLVAAATFLLLLLMTGVFSGPGLFLDIPGTRIRGIFFAEWEFVIFLLYAALPFSIASGLLERWTHR